MNADKQIAKAILKDEVLASRVNYIKSLIQEAINNGRTPEKESFIAGKILELKSEIDKRYKYIHYVDLFVDELGIDWDIPNL